MRATLASMTRGWTVLALIGISLSLARPAAADDDPVAAPLAPMGLGFSVASAVHIAVASILFVEAPHAGGTLCGLTGCFERPDIGMRVGASAVLAAGIGIGVVGVPVWLYGV